MNLLYSFIFFEQTQQTVADTRNEFGFYEWENWKK